MLPSRPLSLRAYLAFIVFLLVLIPASIVIVLAFSQAREMVTVERVKTVGRVADERHEQLGWILRRAVQRGESDLLEMYRRCGALESHQACYQDSMKFLQASEYALGVVLWGPGKRVLTEGETPANLNAPPVLKPEQLAWFTPRVAGALPTYLVVVHDPQGRYHLAVHYSVTNILPLFLQPQPELGQSGETFLVDEQGFFITNARYHSTQGHGMQPISADPMRRCLSPENGETLALDYRDVPIIHGFRFVPEIGAGCIMAHADQSEAFAALLLLRQAMFAALALLLVLAVAAAYFLARWVVKPVVAMTDDIVRFTNHGEAPREGKRPYREVQELYHSFSAMTVQLHQSQQETAMLMAQLEEIANTDKLTGAWNRRRLEEAATAALERLARHHVPVSLLMLDIDHFKIVNDVWGHAVGDQVLAELVRISFGALRSNDSITRWGGEEFVILCPDTSLSTLAVVAERLRQMVELADFPVAGKITISLGVAQCRPDESWQDCLRRADAALYAAKNGGRNQVRLAD